MKEVKNINRPKLTDFVLGKRLLIRENGLKPKEKGTTIGYRLPIEDDKEYVYDLVSKNVYEIYSQEQKSGIVCFKLENIPWENSNETVENGIDEVIEILGKYIEEYEEDVKKENKYKTKIKRKRVMTPYY